MPAMPFHLPPTQRTPGYSKPHLLLELLNGLEVGLVVWTHGGLMAFARLSDPGLQLLIVPLQLAHLLQIVGQAIIQELHGHLLVAIRDTFRIVLTDSNVAGNVAGPWQGASGAAAVGHTEAGLAQRG